MFAIAHDSILRDSLAGLLQLAPECVFAAFRPLPSPGNLVVAVDDVDDENLRFAARYLIANAEKMLKLVAVKRSWNRDDQTKLQNIIDEEVRLAGEKIASAIGRIEQLPNCEWKGERLVQLEQWAEPEAVNWAAVELDDNLKGKVESVTRDGNVPYPVLDEEATSFTSKPPVLHWTADPLEGEVQFIVQLNFSLVGPDDSTFREICRCLKQYADSTYEWTGGILLTSDPVRVHVHRFSDVLIEIAARVCVDELEGESASKPMKLIWPFLAAALKHTVHRLQEHPHLQYGVSLVPFDVSFYTPSVSKPRIFDATVFAATAFAYQKLEFRVNGQMHAVNLGQIFPDGVYSSLSRLLQLSPPCPRRSRPESAADVATPVDAPTPGGLIVSHNRGRRVSFGAIKLMPETNGGPAGVDEYVERMLQQTMDQLAV